MAGVLKRVLKGQVLVCCCGGGGRRGGYGLLLGRWIGGDGYVGAVWGRIVKGRVLEDAYMGELVSLRCLRAKERLLPRGRVLSSVPCMVAGKAWVIR